MTCPLCHQATTWKANPWRPFCSERCQMTDLGDWAAERYRIPGPSLTMDASLRDSCEGDYDTEARQNSEAKESKKS